MDNKVDFYAVSFVKDAQVVHELKDYLGSKVFGPSSHTYSDAVQEILFGLFYLVFFLLNFNNFFVQGTMQIFM